MSDIRADVIEYEREKLELERTKVDLEREKLKLERFKTWWTGGSIMVPIVVVIVTIGFGIWSQNKQAQNQFELQKLQSDNQFKIQMQQANLQSELQAQQAKSQFEIKAAEIVMNTVGPEQTQRKAKALTNIFPDRLPSNFALSFDVSSYGGRKAVKRRNLAMSEREWSTRTEILSTAPSPTRRSD